MDDYGKLGAVRNKDGLWINTQVFREAGIHFMKHGYYCADPHGTSAWYSYWKEERRRCIEGYEVAGARIPGEYYFYLNYCPIQKVEDTTSKKSRKIKGFPDFWDGDYNYYWIRQIARDGVLDLLGDKEKEKKIISLDEMEQIPHLKKLFDKLQLEVKIPTHTIIKGNKEDIVKHHLKGGYNLIVGKSRRKGYQLPHSEVVITPYGKKTMGDIKVGDKVSTPDGKESTVMEVYPQGKDDVYELTLYDGRKVKCGKEHLWKVYSPIRKKGYRQERVVQTDFLINQKLKNKKGYEWYVPLNDKIENKNIHKLPIHPYKMGCVLGDGNVTKELGKKHIPDVYKYHSSIKDRMFLIKGLMDTNGTISKNGDISFCNKSKQLVEDLQEVLYSVGISSIFRQRINKRYILYIKTNENIFILNKKKSKKVRCRTYMPIVSIKKLNYKEDSSCFLLDSKEHLFLTNKYVVTHNSYKNAAVAAYNFFTKPYSLTILNAYEKKFLYPRGIMTMATNYINFINQNTGWTMPSDVVNKTDHIRASYIQYKDGVQVQKGFMSEIVASTCKDNADVNRGKDAVDIIIEESGAFGTPGLLKSLYKASEDCVKAGAIQTGLITIFGTSGDMEGGTADYADMHSRPLAFDLLPFNNIWDKDVEQHKVGFFHPINWNMEGFYDKDGNSDKESAKELELQERKNLIRNGATSTEIQQRMQEKPLSPAEAFSAIGTNIFPVLELKHQLEKVKANDWQSTKGTPVNMYYKEGKVIAKPILDGSTTPITSFYNIPKDKRSCPVIYEYPIEDAPKGLYKIGYDPVRQDKGTSFAAIIVYKGVHIGTLTHDIPVAEYIGRMESADDMDKMAMMFADFYNTTLMYENEVTGVKNYFKRHKRLNLLAVQPDGVISKNIKQSKVARVYGCHMTPQLKDAGERYVKEWLLSVMDYDENGNAIRVIDKIYSVRLLEELIGYNRRGNFDLISALFMCMFQVQEEELGKEYNNKKEHKNAKKLLEMIDNMYRKN